MNGIYFHYYDMTSYGTNKLVIVMVKSVEFHLKPSWISWSDELECLVTTTSDSYTEGPGFNLCPVGTFSLTL